MDIMRYVSACSYISFGLGTVVVVPGVMVHGVEGHATRLHGSCSGEHDVPWDVKSASLEQFVPRGQFGARFGRIRSLLIIPGFQLTFFCSATSIFHSPLSGPQAQAPAYCLQEGLSHSSASIDVTGGGPVSG